MLERALKILAAITLLGWVIIGADIFREVSRQRETGRIYSALVEAGDDTIVNVPCQPGRGVAGKDYNIYPHWPVQPGDLTMITLQQEPCFFTIENFRKFYPEHNGLTASEIAFRYAPEREKEQPDYWPAVRVSLLYLILPTIAVWGSILGMFVYEDYRRQKSGH